jgi:transposase-like protein
MRKRTDVHRPAITERQAEYVAAVVRNNGNRAAAARDMGVVPNTVHDAVRSPGAMAVLTQALAEKGLTAPQLAEKVIELLGAQRAIAVNGPRGEGATLMYGPDGQTQLGAARLVSDVWERASRHAERVAERAERPDAAMLERLTDEELLDALARRGRVARPAAPIETVTAAASVEDESADE